MSNNILINSDYEVYVSGPYYLKLFELEGEGYVKIPDFYAKSYSEGQHHIVFITPDNDVYVIGDNGKNQLGFVNGHYYDKLTKLNNFKAEYVSCGPDYTMFIKNGQVYTCGNNSYIKLGIYKKHKNCRMIGGSCGYVVVKPTDIYKLWNIVSISCGDTYTLFLDKLGDVYILGAVSLFTNGGFLRNPIKKHSGITFMQASMRGYKLIDNEGIIYENDKRYRRSFLFADKIKEKNPFRAMFLYTNGYDTLCLTENYELYNIKKTYGWNYGDKDSIEYIVYDKYKIVNLISSDILVTDDGRLLLYKKDGDNIDDLFVDITDFEHELLTDKKVNIKSARTAI